MLVIEIAEQIALFSNKYGKTCDGLVAHFGVHRKAGPRGLENRSFDAGLLADAVENVAHQCLRVTPAALAWERANRVDSRDSRGEHHGRGRDGHSVDKAHVSAERPAPGAFGAVYFAANHPGHFKGQRRDVRKSGSGVLVRYGPHLDLRQLTIWRRQTVRH